MCMLLIRHFRWTGRRLVVQVAGCCADKSQAAHLSLSLLHLEKVISGLFLPATVPAVVVTQVDHLLVLAQPLLLVVLVPVRLLELVLLMIWLLTTIRMDPEILP